MATKVPMATKSKIRTKSIKCPPRGLASYVIWACLIKNVLNTYTFSLEIRRSGRLRGLQPEYEGLDHTKRTRTPRKTQPKFLDLTETTANTSVSLEELLKPRYTSYTSAVFAYFGFYDEAEIARRRSLRLQGLDPEFEGLTWGQR